MAIMDFRCWEIQRRTLCSHLDIIDAHEVGGGDEDFGLGDADHLTQFMGAVLHGNRADDCADAGNCQISRDQFHDIGQLHHDNIIFDDAELEQVRWQNGQPQSAVPHMSSA